MSNEQNAQVDEWAEDERDAPETALATVDSNALAALNRSEVMVQLDAAHKYARSIKRFMQRSISLATVNVATAESCMYAVPRGGKTISGPSVRLAEITASAYGNLHVGARIVNIGDKEVTAQGVAWDLETNLRVTVEINRRITSKEGRRFNDDMIGVTCAAACSIALRNAIFRVVPRAYIDQVYEKCRNVAVGNAETLVQRRDSVLARLALMGADKDRVLAALRIQGVEDITLEHIELLIGMGSAVKQGERSVDEMFPPAISEVPGADQAGRKMSLKREKAAEEKPAPVKAAPVQATPAQVVDAEAQKKPAAKKAQEKQDPIDRTTPPEKRMHVVNGQEVDLDDTGPCAFHNGDGVICGHEGYKYDGNYACGNHVVTVK